MADPRVYADAVHDTLTATAQVCRALEDIEWERPTGCPGWSVKDNVSHICDVEHQLLGDPPPATETAFGAHVVNAIGERMEPGVALRRSWPPRAVLADLDEVTDRRMSQLREVDEAALEEIAHGHPFGPMPLRSFLSLRVFDLFTHQHDIRRAVGRPGTASGPAAQMTVPQAARALARAIHEGSPETRGRRFGLRVDEIALVVELAEERSFVHVGQSAPDLVALEFDTGNFMAWIGGRSDTSDFTVRGPDTADSGLLAAAVRRHAGMTP